MSDSEIEVVVQFDEFIISVESVFELELFGLKNEFIVFAVSSLCFKSLSMKSIIVIAIVVK